MPSLHCSQAAVSPMPVKTSKPTELTDTVIASTLKVDKPAALWKEEGMLVWKVRKNGRLQARRIGISQDHRTLWITTKPPQGGGLVAAWSSRGGSSCPHNVQIIDIRQMDHVLPGQFTQRFWLATEHNNEADNTQSGGLNLAGGVETAEELSLTLFYQSHPVAVSLTSESKIQPSNGKRRFLFQSKNVPSAAEHVQDNQGLQTLDLIVPSSQQYKELLNALQDMLAMYQKIKARTDATTLLLEYMWTVALKKPSLEENLSLAEWLDICDRLKVPLKKSQLTSLYKEVKKQLPNRQRGLPLWATAQLLDDVRFQYQSNNNVTTPANSVSNPMLRLWESFCKTDPVPNPKNQKFASISSVAFLSFLRTQQREFNLSLEDAVDRINLWNGGKLEKDPRMPQAKFYKYLLSDANDIFDAAHTKDDMSHPLSHYWINSSHDTYHVGCSNSGDDVYDALAYLAVLYRGVRCLELDVWDGIAEEEPVIARQALKTKDDPYLSVLRVFKVIRQFLLSHPKCYPVILNIENHCNYKNQERLALLLFKVLGKSGLIVVPDDSASIDESDLLPSPQAMRGKVLIMGKRPKIIEEGAKVVHDDYDDENDQCYSPDDLPTVLSREQDEATLDKGIVVGFDAAGPVKAGKDYEGSIVHHTAGELLFMAQQDFDEAKMEAAKAELKAQELSEHAERAQNTADQRILEAGLSIETVQELASRVRGDTIDTSDQTLEACRAQGEGVEVQEFFADSVEATRQHYMELENKAIDAAEEATKVLHKLNEVTVKLREAEVKLQLSYDQERKQVAGYQQATAEARAVREDATFAKQRLEKLEKILEECEDSANSAENVVVTALTEAKISEKRAAETEARAARASSKAKEDRKYADEETKKEEQLEKEASVLHHELNKAAEGVTAARKAVDQAAQTLARVNEQIKLIETSTQYQKELKELKELNGGTTEEKKDNSQAGKVLIKHAAKVDERRLLEITMRKSQTQLSECEKKQKRVREQFEKTAHMWKSQTEVASKARRQADKSATNAEDLAEHADEEREAANLRHVAKEKAQSNVSEKEAYRQSLQAQVQEAQRAASELEQKAQAAKSKAGSLEHVTEDLPDHDKIIGLVQRRKAARDHYLAEYHRRKRKKEEAEVKAEEAKRSFETSENVFNQAMRNAARDNRRVDQQKKGDRKALVAFNRARLLKKQLEHAMEDSRYAQSVVTERQIIVKRATEYNEKMARITPIPISLAKMTFLNSAKYRHWDKSFNLPNTHIHSFSQRVLEEMISTDGRNSDRLREFTTEHICRTFASRKDLEGKSHNNLEPVSLWAHGCQLVSLNYSTFDEHVLVADGRFRKNASTGYVLKPEHLTQDDVLKERQETWTIDILCASCLTVPESLKHKPVNPFVKLTLYGGDVDSKKAEHRTRVVSCNGINPIWDEANGFKFTSLNPSLTLCVFTVWSKGENGDIFVGGSALPLACMREGYRSIALFDAYNTRSGAHAHSSLLVKAEKARK